MGLALAAVAAGCASSARGLIDLGPALATRVTGRGFARYLEVGSSSFPDHVRRAELSLGGIDYGPAAIGADTEVAPAAAGTVIKAVDNETYGGMAITIAHGLGWKTDYAHLQARYIGYRERVERRDLIAIMGASGLGASRGGLGVARHLHLTLYGPAWTPLYAGVNLQKLTAERPSWRHVLDPEEFSLGGRNSYLPYSRAGDASHDTSFLALHADAVRVVDRLLDRLGDAAAAQAKLRTPLERDARFDYDVDQRLWFVWNRLGGETHPFSATEAGEHRAALLRFMSVTPRFTSPIVEPARRAEYRARRLTPLKVYDGRTL
jgi:murein DD-endopeptidase MepM/ murein hydrolase activator NlpD